LDFGGPETLLSLSSFDQIYRPVSSHDKNSNVKLALPAKALMFSGMATIGGCHLREGSSFEAACRRELTGRPTVESCQ